MSLRNVFSLLTLADITSVFPGHLKFYVNKSNDLKIISVFTNSRRANPSMLSLLDVLKDGGGALLIFGTAFSIFCVLHFLTECKLLMYWTILLCAAKQKYWHNSHIEGNIKWMVQITLKPCLQHIFIVENICAQFENTRICVDHFHGPHFQIINNYIETKIYFTIRTTDLARRLYD